MIMYIPPSFAVTDPAQLHDFIKQHSFATLISQVGNEPLASHLPLLLDCEAKPYGRLIGHFARANTHWQAAAGQRVLAVFHGPHAYVSPGWIKSQNVVPTWNYVAVHAYGTLLPFENRDRMRDIVRRTVETYEANQATPWSMDQPEAEFIDKLLAAIVGFEIDIDRLEGKWKLNQNHPAERREQILQGLLATNRHGETQIAYLMQEAMEAKS